MQTYSYHIFYFPFKWELPEDDNKLFSDQIDLEHIPFNENSLWERIQYESNEINSFDDNVDIHEKEELFSELQYYFDFVHPVLYDIKDKDNPIIFHFERIEPRNGNVKYHINVKGKEYILSVEAINLNLYSTGVGILSFYLANNLDSQKDENAVRDINQFGRRIMPPHSGEFDSENRTMLAKSIVIKGMVGDQNRYQDFFDYKKYSTNESNHRGLSHIWKPAIFIESLIEDLSSKMKVTPVIDDRMLVNCWYGNDELATKIKNDKDFMYDDNLWYKYIFIDDGKDLSCNNQRMKADLIDKSTYARWQEYGTLYGITRYSLVAITELKAFTFIGMHMRTIYSRMFELIIIQRASILRFSGEVTKVGCLSINSRDILAERISSLYREYIRFINQIYFRSITAQEQGIEFYEMMMEQFSSSDKINELDDEIGELNQYITLLIDKKRNENSEWLNKLAASVLPATVTTGILGMNIYECIGFWPGLLIQLGIISILSIIVYYILIYKKIK